MTHSNARLKGFLLSLLSFSFMAWLIPAASAPQESYYFSTEEKELQRYTQLTVVDWNQSRTVLEQSWIRSGSTLHAKFDISKFPAEKLLDPNLDHIDMLAQANVLLFGSNPSVEQQLAQLIANGHLSFVKRDIFLRMRAAEILVKLKPQNISVLRHLFKPLKESKNWMIKQNIATIYVKASPNLDPATVNSLTELMVWDNDVLVRGLLTLTVLLNSENNLENLKKAVNQMMMDTGDITESMNPYALVQGFIKQDRSRYLETPDRPLSAGLKKSLMDLIKQYNVRDSGNDGDASIVRNSFLRILQM